MMNKIPIEVAEKILSHLDIPTLQTTIRLLSKSWKATAEYIIETLLPGTLEIQCLGPGICAEQSRNLITFKCIQVVDGYCYLVPSEPNIPMEVPNLFTNEVRSGISRMKINIWDKWPETEANWKFSLLFNENSNSVSSHGVVLKYTTLGRIVVFTRTYYVVVTGLQVPLQRVLTWQGEKRRKRNICKCSQKVGDENCWIKYCFDCCRKNRASGTYCAVHGTRRKRSRAAILPLNSLVNYRETF